MQHICLNILYFPLKNASVVPVTDITHVFVYNLIQFVKTNVHFYSFVKIIQYLGECVQCIFNMAISIITKHTVKEIHLY